MYSKPVWLGILLYAKEHNVLPNSVDIEIKDTEGNLNYKSTTCFSFRTEQRKIAQKLEEDIE